MIARLTEKLHEIGFELTATEISEILWLVCQLDKPLAESKVPKPSGKSETPPSPENTGQQEIGTEHLDKKDKKQNRLSDKNECRTDLYSSGLHDQGSYPFPVPAAFALPGKLEMGRAIRPLMQKRPSPYAKKLDEEISIRRIAESQNWIPFFAPALTRWLDVILVIDESSSMLIWKKTVGELQQFFERHGAFRNVQTWGFSFAENRIHLHQGYRSGVSKPGLSRSPLELIDPGKQRLILMVSDCVSSQWYAQTDNQIIKMLRIWAYHNIAAIIHMLPYRLWPRTGLGNAISVYLRSVRPGNVNAHLQAITDTGIFHQNTPKGLKMPVVSLEPDSLRPWAKSLVGTGSRWIRGVVFPDKPAKADIRAKKEPTAEERIKLFISTASPMARRLAGYLSAAPLTLPVMRLVQRVMLPQSRQTDLAEFFLSGLIERKTQDVSDRNPDEIQYDFIEGARERFLKTIRISESVKILENVFNEVYAKLSEFIDRETGTPIDFKSLIADPSKIDSVIDEEKNQIFASVAVKVLERLGGNYKELAERIKKHETKSVSAVKSVIYNKYHTTINASANVSTAELKLENHPVTVKIENKTIQEYPLREIPPEGINNLWYEYNDSDTVIFFVQGLLSDSRSCWLYEDKTNPENNRYWPDLILKDERIGKVSIFLAGFYTKFDSGDYKIENCAYEIFKNLICVVPDKAKEPPISKKNIVFICHSTGGIVIRYMLEREQAVFKDKNIGLILIASPSYGSKLENRLDWLATIYNQQLGKQLKWGNAELQDIDGRFRDLLNDKKIPCLFGTEAYENHFIFHRKFLPDKTKVVTKESAGRYFGAPVLLRNTDHFSTVKPHSFNHPAHELVVDFWEKYSRYLKTDADGGVTPISDEKQEPAGNAGVKSDSMKTNSENTSPYSSSDTGKKIFIICAEEDNNTAKRIYNDLKLLGCNPWLAAIDVKAGQYSDQIFRSVMEKSDYVLALLSKHSLTQRGMALKQLKKALDIFEEFPSGDIFLIPLQLDETKPQEDALRNLKPADFRSSYEEGFNQILRAIELKKIITPNPYPPVPTPIILNFEQKAELINALLRCPIMSDQNKHQTVINNFPDPIKNSIRIGNNVRQVIENIVTVCNNFENGIADLIKTVRFFEGNSLPMKNLEKVAEHLGLQPAIETEFVNRVNELSFITNTYCPSYLLISAPIGYGKTRLLEAVCDHMEKQGWFCIFVKLSKERSNSLKEISLGIIEQLGFKKSDTTDLTIPDICGFEIRECIFPFLKDKKKILLLLDEADRINDDLAKDILNELIPSMLRSFSDLDFRIDFRMIVSGRYLSRWEHLGIPLKSIQLTPFDFHAVHETIDKYVSKSRHNSDYRQKFASDLMYFTGGHPGCMAQILQQNYGRPISVITSSEEKHFDNIIKPVIDEIRLCIPDDLKIIFERISVVRRFTPQMLRFFIDKGLIDWQKNEYDLEDRLLQTYLVNKEKGFLKDDITRRLLSIYLRKTDYDSFKKICKGSIEFYKSKLTDLKAHRPDLIAVELLFQILQDIHYIAKGQETDFFKTLPEIFDMLVKDRDEVSKMEFFRDNIMKDWEFQFYLNYFFRKDTYNDEPFKRMTTQIDSYIKDLKDRK
ncbi:MAG: SAV_2336 N-terminal domain-related protein [Desulfococcaceae bacterium]